MQVYCCRSLALAFLELTVVRRFHEHTHQPDVPPPLRAVLRRLSALYGLWSLSQHTALLYRGEAAGAGRPHWLSSCCLGWVTDTSVLRAGATAGSTRAELVPGASRGRGCREPVGTGGLRFSAVPNRALRSSLDMFS